MRDIISDPNDAVIVKIIIAMIKVQREFLDKHGCHAFQGYLFSKPVPLDQFEGVLRAGKQSIALSSALP